MTTLKTQLNPRAADFQANAAAMQTVVADLHDKVEKIALGGPEAARQKHLARGKLLPRERVSGLLDPGTPFLEIGQFAAYGMYGGDVPAASVIAGIGRVEGVECMIVANDATVKGGTYYPSDREEAPAGAGNRAGKPPALCLSGRFRRRLPAHAG
jgi:3-methylcrotonyl-CoA carboxylase beta subunit